MGSTDIISPIWKLCATNPKSQVAKQCKRASNRTVAFDLWAAEHCRQLKLLLSLAAPLIFARMTTAAEICCHWRVQADFAYSCGPSLVPLSLLAARIFCLHLDSGEASTLCGKIAKRQTQVKHDKQSRATLESCLSCNSETFFSHLSYQ